VSLPRRPCRAGTGNGEAERLGGLHVDDQLILGRCLNRERVLQPAVGGPDARGTRQRGALVSACGGFGPLPSPMGQSRIRIGVELREEGRQVQAESPQHLFDQRLLGVALVGNGGPQLLAIHRPTSSTDPMSGSCEVRPCPPERRCLQIQGSSKASSAAGPRPAPLVVRRGRLWSLQAFCKPR